MEITDLTEEISPEWLFDFIDAKASPESIAEVEIRLGDGGMVTVRAGGPGKLHAPGRRPFTAYEVHIDHDVARFWSKYSQEEGTCVYAQVPRLLLAHHITRHGGIQNASTAVLQMDKNPLPRHSDTELASILVRMKALVHELEQYADKHSPST